MRFRGFIPFEEDLQRKLGPFLEGKGFRASTELIEGKTRALIYTRVDNAKDELVFDAMMWGNYDREKQSLEFNWLRIQVISSGNMIHASPASPSLPNNPYAASGWIYTDEHGLRQSLDEIDDLVRRQFQQWFPDIS